MGISTGQTVIIPPASGFWEGAGGTDNVTGIHWHGHPRTDRLILMLTKAHIKNFKSLRDVSLTLGRNNVLVGPNMSGKSNVIDFFRFVRDMLVPSQIGTGLYNAFKPRTFGSNLDVVWKGSDDPLITFQIEGMLNKGGKSSAWTYTVSIEGDFVWGRLNVREETLTLTRGAETDVVIEMKDQTRTIYGPNGTKISGAIDSNRLALDYDLPNWDGSLVKNSIFSWRFYNLNPSSMRNPNPTAAPNALNSSGDNLSSWLMLLQTRHSDAFERIRSAARDILPDVGGLFTSPTPQSTVYLASHEVYLNRPITIGEMSDGELAFIALLSLLYAPQELKGNVCFIEEPENHLHPRMLTLLTDLLRQIQQEQSSSGGQLLLTTHSPHLVDRFSIDELLVLSKKEGATHVTRPGDRKELKNLISSEEIGLGELFYSGALSGA